MTQLLCTRGGFYHVFVYNFFFSTLDNAHAEKALVVVVVTNVWLIIGETQVSTAVSPVIATWKDQPPHSATAKLGSVSVWKESVAISVTYAIEDMLDRPHSALPVENVLITGM